MRLLNTQFQDNQVCLWKIHLNQTIDDLKELYKLLNEDEVIRARKYRFKEDRDRFIIRRAALRSILSSYIGEKASELVLVKNSYGKPKICRSTSNGRGLQFSISSSGERALLAFATNRRVGVDIEKVRFIPDLNIIVESVFPDNVKQLFMLAENDRQQKIFFVYWCQMEAYLKAIGKGLYDLPLNIPLPNISNEIDYPQFVAVNGCTGTSWQAIGLEPFPGYQAGLWVEGNALELVNQDWSTSLAAVSCYTSK